MTVIEQAVTTVRRRDDYLVYAVRQRAFDDEVDPVGPAVDDPGVLDAFVAIKSADDVETFAKRFGPVGWSRVEDAAFRRRFPKTRKISVLRAAFADLHTGALRAHWEADSIEWVLYQASWMSWCLDVARRQREAKDLPPLKLADCAPVPRSTQEPRDIADLIEGRLPAERFSDGSVHGFAGPARGLPVEPSLRAAAITADRLVHQSINLYVSQVREQVLILAFGGTFDVTIRRSGRALIDALYFELAQRLADRGGRLQLCAREDCGRTFYTRDERTTYCPPVSGKPYAKSPCYEIVRQRKRRDDNKGRGLTSRGTRPQRPPRGAPTVGPTVTQRAGRKK